MKSPELSLDVDNGAVGKKRITREEGRGYLAALGNSMPMAVRYLLQQIEAAYPGGTIELRVPPFGAAQLVGGLNHRRGTPPNVVELSPELFIDLCLGNRAFDEVGPAELSLSGSRAKEVSSIFPLGSDLY